MPMIHQGGGRGSIKADGMGTVRKKGTTVCISVNWFAPPFLLSHRDSYHDDYSIPP